jgi:hypothetical protein
MTFVDYTSRDVVEEYSPPVANQIGKKNGRQNMKDQLNKDQIENRNKGMT